MSSKLREALSKASIYLSWATHGHLTEDDAKECLEVVDTALAEPLKNCEVGTVEEQKQRFDAFCSRGNCDNCPFEEEGVWSNCAIRWSQMPYESEVK
jgi:hypothetical protein